MSGTADYIPQRAIDLPAAVFCHAVHQSHSCSLSIRRAGAFVLGSVLAGNAVSFPLSRGSEANGLTADLTFDSRVGCRECPSLVTA